MNKQLKQLPAFDSEDDHGKNLMWVDKYISGAGDAAMYESKKITREQLSQLNELKVDTSSIINGTPKTIFYEKLDNTLGEILGFTYDDATQTLAYQNDMLAPTVGMTLGQLEVSPGIFVPYSGFTEMGSASPMAIGYVDASVLGGDKSIFLGKQVGTSISIKDLDINLNADENISLNATENVSLNADENISLNATENVSLNATKDFNINATENIYLNATENISLTADEYVNLTATEYVNLSGRHSKIVVGNINTGKDTILFYNDEFGYKPLLVSGVNGSDNAIFGVFGAFSEQQILSIAPSTLTPTTDFETTIKEMAQAMLNYGWLKL